MDKFEKYLAERKIKIEEVDQFLKSLNIHWDRSVPTDETFFELFPVALRYKEGEKTFEDFICVDKYEFTLYRELEMPRKSNVDLSCEWISYRLEKNPELRGEYKKDLQQELAKAQKVKEENQAKIREDYMKKREQLDRQYGYDMKASNCATDRWSKLLSFVDLKEQTME